ncbi:MAG: TetR/AcrR family transcriptional regulator [Clostridia bacterium]|nr:TetR/AcrR family transcriptional regulator [Clostridia bacterium]
MPKIIENLQGNILDEAMKIIDENGIEKLSIRSLANRLNIAPSTVYNYYDSKDQIIGALLRRNWGDALTRIDGICEEGNDTEEALSAIVGELRRGVRPLLRQHISAVTKQKDRPQFDVNAAVIAPLEKRVTVVLSAGRGRKEAAVMAPVLTKLLITCMYDTDIELKDIIKTIKKL